MKDTKILCPECMKGHIIKENEKVSCNNCGEEFIITGKNSVKYKNQ